MEIPFSDTHHVVTFGVVVRLAFWIGRAGWIKGHAVQWTVVGNAVDDLVQGRGPKSFLVGVLDGLERAVVAADVAFGIDGVIRALVMVMHA